MQEWGNKSACVGSLVTMLTTRVQIPSLLSTMSTHWQKELNVAKGSASNYFWPMQKPTSHTMVTKILQITSWVFMRPWCVRNGYPYGWWDVCTHIEGGLQLKGVIVSATFKVLWKELRNMKLGILINYKPNTHPKAKTW